MESLACDPVPTAAGRRFGRICGFSSRLLASHRILSSGPSLTRSAALAAAVHGEPTDTGARRLFVMRRRLLWLVVLLAGTALLPSEAYAKGSNLGFDEHEYAPGVRAVAHARVETWPGSGNEPEGGPYVVYLVRGAQPLWYAHLPSDAIPVACGSDRSSRGGARARPTA
jgi:hypothetical protein